MTTKKFQSQFEEIPTAVPFALTCNGRISGTYTQGMQLAVAPNISIYVKKKVTLAEDVDFARSPPLLWKLSRIDINIMERPRPNDPHIMGLRRPYLSYNMYH